MAAVARCYCILFCILTQILWYIIIRHFLFVHNNYVIGCMAECQRYISVLINHSCIDKYNLSVTVIVEQQSIITLYKGNKVFVAVIVIVGLNSAIGIVNVKFIYIVVFFFKIVKAVINILVCKLTVLLNLGNITVIIIRIIV